MHLNAKLLLDSSVSMGRKNDGAPTTLGNHCWFMSCSAIFLSNNKQEATSNQLIGRQNNGKK